jgi:hypothetical protein
VLLCIGLLFYVLGVSAFGGVAFMILSMPIGKWTTSTTQASASQTPPLQRDSTSLCSACELKLARPLIQCARQASVHGVLTRSALTLCCLLLCRCRRCVVEQKYQKQLMKDKDKRMG